MYFYSHETGKAVGTEISNSPPRKLALSVALIAAAMLMVELVVTRLFSVLFFYHYSFFAVSLVMSGLAFGGLLASRWSPSSEPERLFTDRQAVLALVFSLGIIAALLGVVFYPSFSSGEGPEIIHVTLVALLFVPGLIASGAFLAAAFARKAAWIGRLYAWDLGAAGLACIGAIYLMRTLQGPAALLAPAFLASVACLFSAYDRSATRLAGTVLCALILTGVAAEITLEGGVLKLPLVEKPYFQQWNEHSRIAVFHKAEGEGRIVIDKTAATDLPRIGHRAPGDPPPIEPWWIRSASNVAYRLGRPLERAAIIGVGGGRDLLAALAGGARYVDGYELNGILVDVVTKHFQEVGGMESWPEVSLIHNEARVAIAHSGKKYDVIQASLIDTWAATASGGFVLSENGLYTVEGWRIFLDALSDSGILTMTRWYLPETPAETHRLVSLASASLSDSGIQYPERHVIVVGAGDEEDTVSLATILVSKAPFSQEEIAGLARITKTEEMRIIVAPGKPSGDAVINRLLAPDERATAIRESAYDISPPTDLRPYFFLQLRPRDVFSRKRSDAGFVLRTTFRAVRVLVLLAGLALGFTLAIVILAEVILPTSSADPSRKRGYRWMGLYFMGLGLGYILIQLGMHQRLILILGHPTLALSVVLFSMLLGTGLGSAATTTLFSKGSFVKAWAAILIAVGLLVLALPAMSILETITSPTGRAAAAGLLVGSVGFVLGFGFPLGVRLVAVTGEWAVQRAWAVNGAASVAGSALAAVLGVAFGSRHVLAAGFLCYVLVAVSGILAERVLSESRRRDVAM